MFITFVTFRERRNIHTFITHGMKHARMIYMLLIYVIVISFISPSPPQYISLLD